MLSVYRVLPGLDNLQYVLADNMDDVMKYRFDGRRVGDDWNSPSAYVHNPMAARGDFFLCFQNRAVFGATLDAVQKMVTFFDESCEMLPLDVEGEKLLLCNVTSVFNCLDNAKSRHKENIPWWFDDYVFHRNRFEHSLFKIPETSMSEILCVEGLAAPEDEFKGAVEKLGLKGLIFQEIWRG